MLNPFYFKQFYFKQFNSAQVHNPAPPKPQIGTLQVPPPRATAEPGVTAMKGRSALPNPQYHQNPTSKLPSVTSRTVAGEVQPLRREAAGAVHNPSRLGR